MKIKNYEWHGFGFPVLFDELPALKVRGELVPDVDFSQIAPAVIKFVCGSQVVSLTGNQVKFMRHHLKMSLREFAEFVGVKHPTVIRWEAKAKLSAKIEAHIEIVLRMKILRAIDGDRADLARAFANIEDIRTFREATYKSFKPIHFSKKFLKAV